MPRDRHFEWTVHLFVATSLFVLFENYYLIQKLNFGPYTKISPVNRLKIKFEEIRATISP